MKTKIILYSTIILTCITLLNVSVSIDSNAKNWNELFTEIEALAADEVLDPVDVICSNKGWGKCWEIRDAGSIHWNFWCRYSGYQSDYCPMPVAD